MEAPVGTQMPDKRKGDVTRSESASRQKANRALDSSLVWNSGSSPSARRLPDHRYGEKADKRTLHAM
ncbi:MAG: hypothetical protein DMG56_09180 [Acidobacteria bacterium]|nr:MAG: hypothetical protein DMG56_09180 [Acidobacteriota bacterium]